MRVGVVDIGTNSTRLLVADVIDGRVTELDRRTEVTRLGQGVDRTGRLADEAIERVTRVLDSYRRALDELRTERTVAVLTSAVRDAANGEEFATLVGERYGLDARSIPGSEEARLTFLGATSDRDPLDTAPLVVIDVGGGSTELVVGARGAVEFSVSAQAGVVRYTERHLASDPPAHDELEALAADARDTLGAAVPAAVRKRPTAAVAVAGTATSLAAIDLELEPYDPTRAHGHTLSTARCEELLAHLALVDEEHRREITGLHPDRAPTIVAGVVILLEALRLFGLAGFTASEHDILHGAALDARHPPRGRSGRRQMR